MLVACSPQAPAAQNPSAEDAGPAPVQSVPADQAAQAAAQAPAADEAPQTGLSETSLTIRSGTKLHHFRVEVAASLDQQERGLMFRRSLGPDRGMIFPYNPPQEVAFWMKNTLIPLDIIFIDANGRIARITNAKALDLSPLPSGVPVSGVLEIASGRAAELGLREGDRVRW